MRTTLRSASSLTLAWDAPNPSTGLGEYRIERCASSDSCDSPPWQATVSEDGSATYTSTVSGLEANTPYYFRITALAAPDSGYLDSEPSAILTARTTKITLSEVGDFKVASKTDIAMTLQWGAPENAPDPPAGLYSYRIERCSSSGSSSNPCPDAAEEATPAGTETTHTATNLTPGTTYHFRIRALAAADGDYEDSVWSAVQTALAVWDVTGDTDCQTTVGQLSRKFIYGGTWDGSATSCRGHHANGLGHYFHFTLTQQTTVSVSLSSIYNYALYSQPALYVSKGGTDAPLRGWGTSPNGTYQARIDARVSSGKLIHQSRAPGHSGTTEATLTNLPAGTYTVEVVGGARGKEFTLVLNPG